MVRCTFLRFFERRQSKSPLFIGTWFVGICNLAYESVLCYYTDFKDGQGKRWSLGWRTHGVNETL